MRLGEKDRLGRPFNIKRKTCRVCREEFQPHNGMQIYCGPACASTAQSEERACARCGKTFVLRHQGLPRRYCGGSCAQADRWERVRAERPADPRKELPCERCGDIFQQKRIDQRFCTRACASAWRQTQPKALAKRPGVRWTLAVKGESLCRNCGRQANHLHHIVPRSKTKLGIREVEGNGMPLCGECHRGWHDRYVSIYRNRLLPHELAWVIQHVGEYWLDLHYPLMPDIQLRRLYAVSKGLDPDEQWRFCAEARDGLSESQVDEVGEILADRLVEEELAAARDELARIMEGRVSAA